MQCDPLKEERIDFAEEHLNRTLGATHNMGPWVSHFSYTGHVLDNASQIDVGVNEIAFGKIHM